MVSSRTITTHSINTLFRSAVPITDSMHPFPGAMGIKREGRRGVWRENGGTAGIRTNGANKCWREKSQGCGLRDKGAAVRNSFGTTASYHHVVSYDRIITSLFRESWGAIYHSRPIFLASFCYYLPSLFFFLLLLCNTDSDTSKLLLPGNTDKPLRDYLTKYITNLTDITASIGQL